jgi:[acyl-carrier-protein] S-malonyltransferase
VIAFLFIGQGAEQPWVSPEVLGAPEVAPLVALAGAESRVDLVRLLVRGGRELGRSEVLQPAMVAVCLGVVRLLRRAGVVPEVVLGHSLGELTAWAAAGGITDEDAVRVAALRGRLMAREAARAPGGMLRIMGDRATCERAVAGGAQVGSLCIGAHNGDDEWAVSGDDAALAHVIAKFRATRLPLAGAWHSPAMAGAVDEVHAALAALPRRTMRARWIANRDGRIASDADVPELLAGQLVRAVEWVACLETLVACGATRLIVVGPGKMMRALVYRNLGVARGVEIVDSVRAVATAAAR